MVVTVSESRIVALKSTLNVAALSRAGSLAVSEAASAVAVTPRPLLPVLLALVALAVVASVAVVTVSVEDLVAAVVEAASAVAIVDSAAAVEVWVAIADSAHPTALRHPMHRPDLEPVVALAATEIGTASATVTVVADTTLAAAVAAAVVVHTTTGLVVEAASVTVAGLAIVTVNGAVQTTSRSANAATEADETTATKTDHGTTTTESVATKEEVTKTHANCAGTDRIFGFIPSLRSSLRMVGNLVNFRLHPTLFCSMLPSLPYLPKG